MKRDEIVAEIRRIRDEHAAKFGNDLAAIFADMREKTEKARESGRKVVSLPSRPPPKRVRPRS